MSGTAAASNPTQDRFSPPLFFSAAPSLSCAHFQFLSHSLFLISTAWSPSEQAASYVPDARRREGAVAAKQPALTSGRGGAAARCRDEQSGGGLRRAAAAEQPRRALYPRLHPISGGGNLIPTTPPHLQREARRPPALIKD
ncbi:unnamed protein product [Urochloa humidicola]